MNKFLIFILSFTFTIISNNFHFSYFAHPFIITNIFSFFFLHNIMNLLRNVWAKKKILRLNKLLRTVKFIFLSSFILITSLTSSWSIWWLCKEGDVGNVARVDGLNSEVRWWKLSCLRSYLRQSSFTFFDLMLFER